MLKLRFRYRFEAAHRFLVSPSLPCRTPHGHSWHGTLVVSYPKEQLNQNSMSLPFEDVKLDWKRLLNETLDHSFFHHWKDPLIPSLIQVHPESRLLPFPGDPTTELLGVLLFAKMRTIFSKKSFRSMAKVHEIIIEETPSNSVVISKEFFEGAQKSLNSFEGWWNSTLIEERTLKKLDNE